MSVNRKNHRAPWNKGKIVGQKAPLKLREIWAIRVRLQLRCNLRDLALFNPAIDSKLRACELLGLRVGDIAHENRVNSRAVVMQRKTRRPVQFEITEMSRDAINARVRAPGLRSSDHLFPSRSCDSSHLSTRQYARIVHRWVREIGLDSSAYDTHNAKDKGSADISSNEESPCRATATRPQQAREHRSLPWNRGRRRTRNFRTNRSLSVRFRPEAASQRRTPGFLRSHTRHGKAAGAQIYQAAKCFLKNGTTFSSAFAVASGWSYNS